MLPDAVRVHALNIVKAHVILVPQLEVIMLSPS